MKILQRRLQRDEMGQSLDDLPVQEEQLVRTVIVIGASAEGRAAIGSVRLSAQAWRV